MHDILIKNGTLVDGSGATRTQGDIAIDGDNDRGGRRGRE